MGGRVNEIGSEHSHGVVHFVSSILDPIVCANRGSRLAIGPVRGVILFQIRFRVCSLAQEGKSLDSPMPDAPDPKSRGVVMDSSEAKRDLGRAR